MNELVFAELDPSIESDIVTVARVHCAAPIEWSEDHSYTEEDLKRTVEQLKNAETNQYVLLARNPFEEIIGLHWVQLEQKPETKRGHIKSLWVHPDYRQLGIATQLKTLVEQWMAVNGVTEIRTQVYLKNERMVELNKRLGFDVVMVGMVKTLTPSDC